jgi:hypothetical protein
MINNTKILWVLVLLLVNVPLSIGGDFDEVVDDPALPRVLLIGDSISIGYTTDTREMLKGKANVHRPPLNCMYSSYVAANIKDWLGEEKWDVKSTLNGIKIK